MRLSSLFIVLASFAIAAILSLVAASFSADLIEDTSQRAVEDKLAAEKLDWAEVHAEGLQVFLAGTAPTEAARFRAVSAAGHIVDAARVIDNMQVEATADIAPPRFTVEILRNDAGISLIGLVPAATGRAMIREALSDLDGTSEITDFLETATYEPPDGWTRALRYALRALEDLPRAKVSVEAGAVSITAMADSPEARSELEAALLRRAPRGITLDLQISAPRPVITPFTLRFLIDDTGARFDACSADTEKARTRILTAARAAGAADTADCTIGLGVPTPSWTDAVETAIAGLHDMGGGSVTFSDADVTLVARAGTPQATFDRVVGELETGLPDVFALHSTLPDPPEEQTTTAIPEFTATLSPEGLVQLRGRLPGELARQTAESYARARFGSDVVHMAARLDDTLPASWQVRVMAGLDALSALDSGALTITPASVAITGRTGNPDANAAIALHLADKLSQTDHFSIDVTYVEALDPVAALPTPEECVADLQAIQSTDRKIAFEPGSGTLGEGADAIIDDIAEKLRDCSALGLTLEIQGHTDSQGRESMNQALSQTRAQSVLNALQDRRILTKGITAVGYGESQPIADNDTEEGREANRRIEFVLVTPETDTGADTDTDTDTGTADETAAEGDSEDGASDTAGNDQTTSDTEGAQGADATGDGGETTTNDTN